jgi:hypothetical protein
MANWRASLVKVIGGSVPYDRLVDTEIASAERRFGRKNDTQDAIADQENATTLWKAKAEAAQRRKEPPGPSWAEHDGVDPLLNGSPRPTEGTADQVPE